MKGRPITVNSRKYDRSLRRSWSAHLVERSESHILLEGYFESEVRHPELGVIAKGTRSVETFFFDRWYNYFSFYEPTREFRNHYINISMPPQMSDDAIDYVDLDIDVIVWPDGQIEVLDEQEFRENARLYGYPDSVVSKAEKLKQEILRKPDQFITITVT